MRLLNVLACAAVVCTPLGSIAVAQQVRGVQAVILDGWDSASVVKLKDEFNRTPTAKALGFWAFSPLPSGKARFANARTFLDGLRNDMQFKLIVHLSFHNHAIDPVHATVFLPEDASELQRRTELVLAFLKPYLDGSDPAHHPLLQNLTVEISPMLEDRWDAIEASMALATVHNVIQAQGAPFVGRVGLRQSPEGSLRPSNAPAGVPVERHGPRSNRLGAASFSNDGNVVYLGATFNLDGVTPSNQPIHVANAIEDATSFSNEGSAAPDARSVGKFRDDTPGPSELLLWRYAYNLDLDFRDGNANKLTFHTVVRNGHTVVQYSIETSTNPAQRDVGKVMTPAEVTALRKFLGTE